MRVEECKAYTEPTRVITSVSRGMPEDWIMGGGRGRGIQMGVAHSNERSVRILYMAFLASYSAQFVDVIG